MFSVNYIFLLNITYVFAIITCLGFLVNADSYSYAEGQLSRDIELIFEFYQINQVQRLRVKQ